ncbi:glycerophosphodiester phosphodiesterase [Streptomonospora salina]|uniref:Glycerophosphoryl diester phosphodiesterase n=1 Tax=Streptomonospora salina TaxID=104205 RepID=A0A841EDN5_9ACTN|nr:glycerophosphodiester phosphodiesterase [Streptomonospora salina]MBB6000504.1 glycerophosphoryl diester phosphodiesterase [Streptomonospora salina]
MTLATALRGDTSRYRENTLPALRAAIAAGADALAVDLRTTGDGHVVVVGDRSLREDWGLDRAVGSAELADLAVLGDGVEQRIPTFMEVLAEAGRGAAPRSLLCEVDSAGTALAADAVVGEHGMNERVCFTGSVDTLRNVRAKLPSAGTALTWEQSDLPGPEVWEDLRPDVFSADHRVLTRELVVEIQRHGYSVTAWTVDDFAEMVRLAGMGVDAIVTSNIGELAPITRNGENTPESGPRETPSRASDQSTELP